MNDIIIQAYSNRKLSKKAVDIGNMQENEVTRLIFEFDDGITALGGNAYLVVSYDDESYPYPLKDNTFTVGRELTQRKKTEANIIITTSEDETNPLNGVVWISNTLNLLVDKNSINIDSINEQELPPSLKIIYDELLNLEKELQEKMDNNYWKGEPGENGTDGKTAYQYAQEGGFAGTEQEFSKKLAEVEYKANSIISKSSGEVVTTTDSAKAKPKNIKLFGKTEQDSTEGNQLLPYPYHTKTKTENGVTFTDNGDGSITITGTCTSKAYFNFVESNRPITLSAGKYRLNTMPNNVTVVVFDVNNKTYLHNPIVITEDTQVGMWLDCVRTSYNTTVYPMFYKDGGDGTWEPYTGGEASPNMNYPQPLNSHGDSGSIVGKVLTGNLLKNIATTQTINGVTFKVNEDGTVIANGTATATTILNLLQDENGDIKDLTLQKGNYIISGCPKGGSFSTYKVDFIKGLSGNSIATDFENGESFVLTEKTTIKQIRIVIYSGVTVSNLTFKPMIRCADIEDDTYEPYTEQPFTVLTPNGLKGIPLGQTIPDAIKNSPIHMAGVYWDNTTSQYYIGDTKDYENGEYVQRIAEIDNSNWVKASIASNTTGYRFQIQKTDILKKTFIPIMCTHFQVKREWTYNTEGTYIATDEAKQRIICLRMEENSPFTTTDECIAWMNENDVKTNYVLATPIITNLTQEELDQYNALLMNYPNTTVVNDAGAYMEVEYVADTKEHIKQNYVAKSEHEALKERVSEIENVIANL